MTSKLTAEAHLKYLTTLRTAQKKEAEIRTLFETTVKAYNAELQGIINKHIEDNKLDATKIESFNDETGEFIIKE